MSSNKKKQFNDEIDLFDVIFAIWNDKWKIILISVLTAMTTLFYQQNQQPNKLIYLATTEIKSISTYDEFEYQDYNSIIKGIDETELYYIDGEQLKSSKVELKRKFKPIDKSYLLNLFLDKFNDDRFFINEIKKFGLLKREDYIDNQEYDYAVKNLANSIQLSQSTNDDEEIPGWKIKYKISDKKNWEKFLTFIEKSTNNEVQKYLIENFERSILSEKRLIKYQIEDIEIEILNTTNIEQINKLKKQKKMLEDDKNLQRLQYLFETTPIVKSNKFSAAKIKIPSTRYKTKTKKKASTITMFFLAGFIGAIAGIFYVLISNSIKERKKIFRSNT